MDFPFRKNERKAAAAPLMPPFWPRFAKALRNFSGGGGSIAAFIISPTFLQGELQPMLTRVIQQRSAVALAAAAIVGASALALLPHEPAQAQPAAMTRSLPDFTN